MRKYHETLCNFISSNFSWDRKDFEEFHKTVWNHKVEFCWNDLKIFYHNNMIIRYDNVMKELMVDDWWFYNSSTSQAIRWYLKELFKIDMLKGRSWFMRWSKYIEFPLNDYYNGRHIAFINMWNDFIIL